MEEETLNGTPLSYWGVIMLNGSYAALMKPADPKEWVKNEDPKKNGTDYIVPDNVAFSERTVNLLFGIEGADTLDFLAKYTRFVNMLQSGMCQFYVPALGRYYHLKYDTCAQFNNHTLKACDLAVRFTEPDPTKTTL